MHWHKALMTPFGRGRCRTIMVSALCVVLTACQSVARQGGSEQHVDSPKLPNVQPNNSNRLKEDLSQGLSVENNSGYVPDDTGHTSTNVLVSNAASIDNCEINIPDELSTKQGVYSTEALLKWEVARLHLQLDCMKAMQGLVPVNVKPATATVSVEPIQSKNTLADRWRPASRSDDRDLDGVLDHLDRCPDTEESITVGKNGCGLFDEILHDVKFSRASVFLSNEARAQLDGVAEMLLAFPESGVLIRVHTDSTGTPAENLAISARRANIIAQYLLKITV